MIRLTATLADGTVIEATVRRMPKHWQSYLMQRAPYGTDFLGATWARERVS